MEILLAMAVLLLLGGLVVLNLPGLLASKQLEEGAAQFETVLRLARTEAANMGRKVRLEFDPQTSQCKVTCEASPLTDPGVFGDYAAAAWTQNLPNGLVDFARSELTGASAVVVTSGDQIYTGNGGAGGGSAGGSGGGASGDGAAVLSPVTFYPDGSSDSAVFELRGHGVDDLRTAVIVLDGLNGTIDTQVYQPSEYAEYRAQADAPAGG